MNILLSNDDGIRAQGLRSLYAALLAAGHKVRAVAPSIQHSGAACSITTRTPLTYEEIHEPDFDGYAVDGTPADCVLLALGGMFETGYRPDVVLSGINWGPNAGLDVLYSGTVAAALQGTLLGIPAIAVSSLDMKSANTEQARETVNIMERLTWDGLPEKVLYNLNFPACEASAIRGLKVCPMSTNWDAFGAYEERCSPHGKPYWWLGDMTAHFMADAPGMDKGWLKQNYATLTPLRFDLTDYQSLDKLRYLEKDAG